jgi:hypothetical protein
VTLKLCDLSAVRSCLYSVLSTKCEVCRVHRPTRHTSHASSGQNLFGSRKIKTDVACTPIHNINTYKLEHEMAECHLILTLQNCDFIFIIFMYFRISIF